MTRGHIAFMASHFRPESNAGANRITALAEFLAQVGWKVTVVTQLPHHPQNKIYPGWESADNTPVKEDYGIEVIRLRPWLVPKDKLHWRLLSELVFSVRAVRRLRRLQADVYFSSSPYMFVGPATALLARMKRSPFAWDVRDLTWLYPGAAGRRTFRVDKVLASLMRWTARQARLLTATTHSQLAYFGDINGVSLMLPNGVSRKLFQQLSQLEEPFVEGKRPIVAYAGLFGYNHNLRIVAEAAKLVPEAEFLLVGDGPEKIAIEAEYMGVPNLEFRPYQPFEALLQVYSSADILLQHFRKSPVFQAVQSAKVFEYMAAGRPVIYASEGEAIQLMLEQQIGLAVAPDDPQALAKSIRSLIANPVEARSMAERAKEFVRSHRIREELFRDYDALLRQLISS